jgi:tetratricopeptide (TPR) repeat protein
VLSGADGVGKTALALHWAHARASGFPEGAVYVDLDGGCGGPVRPEETSRLVLEGLGLPDERIPDGLQARSELYREMVTGRRLLILDNVPEAAHVRNALPADPNVVVLAVSRYALPGLSLYEQADQIRLEPLPISDAMNLLGADEELAQLCGRMPLALRLARGAPGPGEGRKPMAAWEVDEEEAGIRAAFDLAYQGLEPEAARAIRILATLPLASVSVDCAAAALDLGRADARRILETLRRRRFVGEGYRMHDQVRLCVLECAHEQEQLDAALRRVADWYRGQACDRTKENRNFTAMLECLSRKGWHGVVARLAASWFDFYHEHRLWREWVEAYTCACESARFDSDWQTSIRLLTGLGVAHKKLGRFEESADAYHRALDIATGVGDEMTIGPILSSLGGLCLAFDRTEQAKYHLEAALAVPGYASDPCHAPEFWLHLTHLHFHAGDFKRATQSLHRGFAAAGRAGDPRIVAHLHHWAGELALRQRHFEAAAGSAAAEFEIARDLGDPLRQAYALELLASATAHRQPARARSLWLEAQALCAGLGHRLGTEISETLRVGGQARPERRVLINSWYV